MVQKSVILGCLLFGVGFRMLTKYLAYHSDEFHWNYRMMLIAGERGPGIGPVHLMLESAAEIGFA